MTGLTRKVLFALVLFLLASPSPLSGAEITIYSSGGVSGVISSSETKHGLFLHEDGTFRFEITEFTSVSSGGYSVPSEEKRSGEGKWAVEMIEDKTALVLRQEGAIVRWWHAEDGGSGVQYLNGERWGRYLIGKYPAGESENR